jgi:cell wall-associated NlpC family hydrolase
MGKQEAKERAEVVAYARRWISTPYHHAADVLGAGVDCGMSGVRWFVDTGIIPAFDPRPYPADWMLHNTQERYLDIVAKIAGRELDLGDEPPIAGDWVVWKFGKTFSHGALVTGAPGTLSGWPWVCHAYAGAFMVEEIDTTGAAFTRIGGKPRPLRAFSAGAAA